jgi:hypothetical protein
VWWYDDLKKLGYKWDLYMIIIFLINIKLYLYDSENGEVIKLLCIYIRAYDSTVWQYIKWTKV